MFQIDIFILVVSLCWHSGGILVFENHTNLISKDNGSYSKYLTTVNSKAVKR